MRSRVPSESAKVVARHKAAESNVGTPSLCHVRACCSLLRTVRDGLESRVGRAGPRMQVEHKKQDAAPLRTIQLPRTGAARNPTSKAPLQVETG